MHGGLPGRAQAQAGRAHSGQAPGGKRAVEGNRLGTGTEQPFRWEAEQRLRPEASSSQENIPRAAGDLAHHPLPQTSFLPACLPQCQQQSAWPGAPC